MKVLLVEDDAQILELLKTYFETKGHEVTTASDGVEALEKFGADTPDVMLLDIVLPRMDGWAVLEAVRSSSQAPVVLLTSLDDTENVVKGLAMGADDYLSKPFQIRELDARIQAILRRLGKTADSATITAGTIYIDDRAKRVTIGGEPVSLTPKEYDLLKLLAGDPGRVFSSDEIIARLWEHSSRATSSDVKQYVHLLRNKIELDPQAPKRIQNVKGFGYKLMV